MNVFSSRTGKWEEREFAREGDAAVTFADVASDKEIPTYIGSGPQRRYAEYWRGCLYIHCRGSYLTRLSLSDNKYKVVKTPTMVDKTQQDSDATALEFFGRVQPYLGRSEKGVCFVEIYRHQLWIWMLDDESHVLMEWNLIHQVNLVPVSQQLFRIRRNDDEQLNSSAWALEDYAYYENSKTAATAATAATASGVDDPFSIFDGSVVGEDSKGCKKDADDMNTDDSEDEEEGGEEDSSEDPFQFPFQDDDMESLLANSDDDDDTEEEEGEGKNEVESKDESGWNSDDDYSLNLDDNDEYKCPYSLDFLGFHPYKEVIFLGRDFRSVAYHLASSKAQYLGRFFPCRMCSMLQGAQMLETFPYTPCFTDALPEPAEPDCEK